MPNKQKIITKVFLSCTTLNVLKGPKVIIKHTYSDKD